MAKDTSSMHRESNDSLVSCVHFPSELGNSQQRQQQRKEDEPLLSPPVKLVDLTHLHKGNGLVACRKIVQGEIIWTEACHPAATIQMPSRSTCCYSNHNNRENSAANRPFGPKLACENCFCNLEPVSAYFYQETEEEENRHGTPSLPAKHLWPVTDYSTKMQMILNNNNKSDEEDNELEADTTKNFIQDLQGRCVCRNCQILFCSSHCRDIFSQQVSHSCCQYRNALEAIQNVAYYQDHDTASSLADHWVIVMAMRLFCGMLTVYRTQDNVLPANQCIGQIVQGMCGDVSDEQGLELGINTGTRYTVEPFYKAICTALQIGELTAEQALFSLEFFEQLTAACRRNTLNVKTKSSFTTYEENILTQNKTTGSCGSDKINVSFEDIGKVLIHHGYYADVEALGQVDCCAMLPLFAKMNHSCDPSVDVIDALVPVVHHKSCATATRIIDADSVDDDGYFYCCSQSIQLVALRDICEGEELSVSYLSSHAMSMGVAYRMEDLKAKFLFTCECSRCTAEQHY